MQSCESQVARFSDPECHLDGFKITHFTDQYNIRVLAECGSKCRSERVGVSRHFTLVHNAILVIVKELDRVLDREDMLVPIDVDLVDHRRKRCRFTRTS